MVEKILINSKFRKKIKVAEGICKTFVLLIFELHVPLAYSPLANSPGLTPVGPPVWQTEADSVCFACYSSWPLTLTPANWRSAVHTNVCSLIDF